MSRPIHLFLLVPNDSGSTWLQNIISLCRNCVSFPAGLDGKGACGDDTIYPSMDINKLFSEERDLWETPGAFDWPAIKNQWQKFWSENKNYNTANPKVYLEKTPQAIFASDMYFKQFDNVRFITMTRNPYAVSEGMRRTILKDEEIDIRRCAKHWIRCAKRQIYNYGAYKGITLEFTYEQLVQSPVEVEQKIREFIPALEDIDLQKEAVAHSLDGMKAAPVTDFNAKHIENLSSADIKIINEELEKFPKVLEYFGYTLLKGGDHE